MAPTTTHQTEHYDLVVLGSGEAGKYIAWTMASAGKKAAVIGDSHVGDAVVTKWQSPSASSLAFIRHQPFEMPAPLKPGEQQQAGQTGERADHEEPHPAGRFGNKTGAR